MRTLVILELDFPSTFLGLGVVLLQEGCTVFWPLDEGYYVVASSFTLWYFHFAMM